LRAAFALLLAASTAHAKRHPQFEPTDLELEDTGVMELDLQVGVVKGADANRIVLPDFELDLGLLANLELDLDGTYAIADGHSAPDNLWASLKVGLYDGRDDPDRDDGNAWALGVQAGPKLPTGSDQHGVGAEALALIGRVQGPAHLVLGVGGLIDPHVTAAPRPWGLAAGLDLELDLDTTNHWALLGELAASWFGSPDPTQCNATIGIQYSATPRLDLSIVGEVGFVPGSDPYGIFFGFSPKLGLW
jgi:hypothetical protein